jgi:hypothetical protein
MTQKSEHFQEITEHGVIPSPSGAGALLLHPEEGYDCLLVLGVFRKEDRANLTAILTLRGCLQSVFGYPNDEAYGHDPRAAVGERLSYGFYEVVNSTWPERLIAYNRHAFPDSTPPHYAACRHYFVGCHDASGQFLAESLEVELTSSYAEAIQEALRRVAGPLVQD